MKWILMTFSITAAVWLNACNKNSEDLKARPTGSAKSAGGAEKVEGAFLTSADATDFNMTVPSRSAANLVLSGEKFYAMDILCTNTIVSGLPAEKAPRLRLQGQSQVLARESIVEPIPGREGEEPKPLMNLICKTKAAALKPGTAPNATSGTMPRSANLTGPSAKAGTAKNAATSGAMPEKSDEPLREDAALTTTDANGEKENAGAVPTAAAPTTTAPSKAAPMTIPANVKTVDIKSGEGTQLGGLFAKDQTEPVQVNIACVENKAFTEASKALQATDGSAPDLVLSVGSKILFMTELKTDGLSSFALISCLPNKN
jgi:hypothetical protein